MNTSISKTVTDNMNTRIYALTGNDCIYERYLVKQRSTVSISPLTTPAHNCDFDGDIGTLLVPGELSMKRKSLNADFDGDEATFFGLEKCSEKDFAELEECSDSDLPGLPTISSNYEPNGLTPIPRKSWDIKITSNGRFCRTIIIPPIPRPKSDTYETNSSPQQQPTTPTSPKVSRFSWREYVYNNEPDEKYLVSDYPLSLM